MSDLPTAQRSAVVDVLKVALSGAGYEQVLDNQKSDDWLSVNIAGGGSGFVNPDLLRRRVRDANYHRAVHVPVWWAPSGP